MLSSAKLCSCSLSHLHMGLEGTQLPLPVGNLPNCGPGSFALLWVPGSQGPPSVAPSLLVGLGHGQGCRRAWGKDPWNLRASTVTLGCVLVGDSSPPPRGERWAWTPVRPLSCCVISVPAMGLALSTAQGGSHGGRLLNPELRTTPMHLFRTRRVEIDRPASQLPIKILCIWL